MYTVYIIHSARHDRHYVGFTSTFRTRLKQHRAGATRSVPASDDWAVLWSTVVTDSAEARALEKRIKARGASRYLADHR